jgi:signal transduction histidine kinase/CheY-like chemotaxis protein
VVGEVLRSKASVFVELQRRTVQLTRQSEQIRQHERREHERALDEERRRWEAEALRRQMHELAEADRRKDEFLAVLGHELRNPLSAIVAGCELLEHKLVAVPKLDPSILRTRDRIDRQAQHLRRLVDDLLDLGRINSGKIELKLATTSVQDVIEQAIVTSSQPIEERAHELIVEVPPEPVILRADPVRLIQGVANLLNNAARYTEEGGKIWIKCRPDPQARKVQIQVSDSGRGISAEMLPRVFDIFVQADGKQAGSSQGGLGLGLTIVKRLVDLHHGTVTAASEGPGRGSTFTITLDYDPSLSVLSPTVPSPTALAPGHEAGGPAAAVANPTASLSVVLIEDNEDIRDSMKEFLTELGHRVQVASDGGSGLELILKLTPDVAIVDVGLPVLDGYEVASRVRSHLGRLRPRMVAMTGYGQESDRRRAREAGFDSHLVKPAEMNAVLEVLRPRDTGAATPCLS